MDAQQVQLKLTDAEYVLNELRRKKRLAKVDGVETFQIQFDSRTINFKRGGIVTVGRTIADCLLEDAYVIVGADIDGEVTKVLEIVKEYNLGDAESTPTTCAYCKEDQGTVKQLAAHLLDVHNDEIDPDALEAPSHAPARNARKVKDANAD